MKTSFAALVLAVFVMLGMPAFARAADADWKAVEPSPATSC